MGLADELADATDFEAVCRARIDEFMDKDPRALAVTKAWLREAVLAEMMAHEAERLPAFLDGWFSPGTRERMLATVAGLKAKG